MDQTKDDITKKSNIEEPIATLKENILPTEQNESEPVKEEFHNLKCSTLEELRKFHSDSSAFSDYSSENSETVADSDKSYDTEYPKIRLNKRSKSLMFKKKVFIENVVNEESIEEERDNSFEVKKNPYRFSNFEIGDDIPNFSEDSKEKFYKMKKMKTISNSPIILTHHGYNSNTFRRFFMDPVVEVKEDGEQKNEIKYSLNSPRITYLKDNFEDISMKITTPTKNFFTKDYSMSVENVETIAEDNNENAEENNEKPLNTGTIHHKMIENVIDKEENYEIKELKITTDVIDVIKEEPLEEEVYMIHGSEDEIDNEENNQLLHSKNFGVKVTPESEDDFINELDELKIDEEKEEENEESECM